jgi:HlyD family secretion protein
MKKFITIIVILVSVGAGGAVFYAKRGDKEPTVSTLSTSRGSIIDAVGATGTLQAVTTVTVGTQVSGIVQSLEGVDFNSIVKKGQIIARLDPSILETQVETAKANLANAQANLERQKVAVTDAKAKLTRAQELANRQLINKVDLENADVTLKQADAQLKSTESQIVQADAAVNKAKVDLDHTIITAPIDGIIIKRSVDRGQTVNAGMSAPELFIIAADLTKMQVNANIDESDVGRMRPGEAVSFRVDAYPTETFRGTVRQVRLNPQTVQNVVTYSTVIDVPNAELKLKPGMTANVTIEIARREHVLRVPNAALRFRPTKDIFEALNQTIPPELERGMGGRGNRGDGRDGGFGQAAGAPAPAPAANEPGAAPQRQGSPREGSGQPRPDGGDPQAAGRNGGGNGPGGGDGQGGPGGGNFDFGGRDGSGGNFAGRGAGGQPGAPRSRRQDQAASTSKSAATTNATTIDALFAPLQTIETRGRAWLFIDKQLKPITLRLGISDGTYTEVLNDTELPPGAELVTSIITPAMAAGKTTTTPNNANGNPLLPAQRGRPGGPGGFGGRGGG